MRRSLLLILLVVALTGAGTPFALSQAPPVDAKTKSFVVMEIQSVRIVTSRGAFDRKNWLVSGRVLPGGDPAAHGFKACQEVTLRIHSPVMTFGATEGLAGRRFAITYLSAPSADYAGGVVAKEVVTRKKQLSRSR